MYVVFVMSEVFMMLAGVCGVLKFVVSMMFVIHTVCDACKNSNYVNRVTSRQTDRQTD